MARVVVVTGLDGAGKTTYATALGAALRHRGVQARYVHQFAFATRLGRVAAWGTALLSPVVQGRLSRPGTSAHAPSGRRPLRAPAAVAAGIVGAVLLAAGAARTWARIVLLSRTDVVVFDRYFYDDLIRAEWKFGLPVHRWPLLSRAVPVPDVIIYLVTSLEASWRRKKRQDTTLAALGAKQELYERWMTVLESRGLPVRRVRSDGRPVDVVAADVLATALAGLPAPSARLGAL